MAQEPIERIDIEVNAQTDRAVSDLTNLEKILNRLGKLSGFRNIDGLSDSLGRFSDAAEKAGDAASRINGINAALRTTEQRVAQTGARAEQAAGTAVRCCDRVQGRLGGLMGFLSRMALRRTISAILSGIRGGLDNLYQYSAGISGLFASSMDRIATSAQYLQNSLGSALAPLMNTLAPVLDAIVDKIVDAINWFNQLVAVLSGKSTWTRAVKVQRQYAAVASGVGKTAKESTAAIKELQRTVMGFDELNLLNDAASAAGGGGGGSAGSAGGTDYGSMFEEVPIDQAFESVQKVADFILTAVEKIRQVMDFLGIDMNDLLKIAGLVAGAIAAWKIGTGFMSALQTVISTVRELKVPIGITMAVAGFALEATGMYQMGRGDWSLGNIIKSALGAALGITGLTIAFGTTGLIIGLAAALVIGVASYEWGTWDKAKEDFMATELYQRLQESINRSDRAIEIAANIKLDIEKSMREISDLELKFATLRDLIEQAFTLSGKKNKTLDDMIQLEALVAAINDLGVIELHIENGEIVEAKDEVEKLIDANQRLFMMQGYQNALITAYEDQAKATAELSRKQQDLSDDTGELYRIQQALIKSFTPAQTSYNNLTKMMGVMSLEAEILTGNVDALKFKSLLWTDEQKKMISALETTKEAVSKDIEAVDGLENSLSLANDTIDTCTRMLNDLNTQNVSVDIEDGQVTEATEHTETLARTLADLNKAKGTISIDDAAIDNSIEKLKTLKKAVADVGGINIDIDTSGIQEAQRQLDGLNRKMNTLQPVTPVTPVPSTSVSGKKGRSGGGFASGGFPDTGEMFIAREAGPELVGTIGGKTAVANNAQIEAGIAAGVRDANDDVVAAIYAAARQIIESDRSTGVYLDGRAVSKSVTDGQNRANRMYGSTLQNV